MDNEKVYTPQTIPDNPFPGDTTSSNDTSQTTANQTFSQEKIADTPLPSRKLADEVISNSFNSLNKKILAQFEFTPSGAIQIGQYEQGLSGDIKISPAGIVARNLNGETTFALDGETGDATFKGTVTSGSVITGSVLTGLLVVGDNSIKIDGASRTIIINDGTNDIILIGYQAGGF